MNRLEEAKTRSQIYASLHEIDSKVRRKVQLVWKKFNDVMTYQVCIILSCCGELSFTFDLHQVHDKLVEILHFQIVLSDVSI